eukprot:7936119-Lingulodinium_polyedra.AAC.1
MRTPINVNANANAMVSQGLAFRARRTHHASTSFWCSHGARGACEMLAAAAADNDGNRIVV